MKKISIIGANSYIARNLVFSLNKLDEQFVLHLYDREDAHADGVENYKSVQINDIESIQLLELDCDLIFMFVGKTGSTNGFDLFEEFIDINEKALLNLLNEYRRQNSKAKIIFPSTRLVYRGMKGLLKEDSEKEFKTIYAINKFACETYLKQYNEVFGIPYCIFRICVPYGTLVSQRVSYGTAGFMINKAISGENISLYGDGLVRRTLTYIGDLCNALIKGAFSAKCINDVYNIGGENYSLREMAELISSRYHVGIDYIDYPEIAEKTESGDTVFDDGKIQKCCPVYYNMKFEEWCLSQNV